MESRTTDASGPVAGSGGRVYPWVAVLLAAASVLEPLSWELHEAPLGDGVPALAVACGFAVLVWLAAAALRRRADAGAALIACLWVAGSLYYLELVRHLNRALGGDYSMVRPLPVALAVMIGLTFALAGRRRWHGFAHTVVAGIAVALLAKPLWVVADFERRHGAARAAYDGERAMAAMPELARAGGAPGEAPDIYHFVFDRYGSEETLRERYGVGEPIGTSLEARGFYVARDSFANYVATGHSLASTFAMDYLTELAADPRVSGANWLPLFEMLDDHRVGRFLRGQGYEVEQFGSWWAGTHRNPNADRNWSPGLGEFAMAYGRRTILMPILHLLPDTPFTMMLDWDNGQCQRVARQVEAIKRSGNGERPTFVFAHILVPHGPFVFGPDGRCLGQKEAEARGEDKGYAEQVAYADRIIEELVGALLAEGRRPAVVLIQADEGPIPPRDMSVPWQEASDEELRAKFGILSAWHFPDGDYGRLRQDISPVNSYRVILGKYFGLDLPELPDRMYVFPDHTNIWEFHDVTDRVRCAAPALPADDHLPPC
jgi:hypothetical protein